MNLRSWWTFLWHERLGYFRPSELSQDDYRLRDEAMTRWQELELITRKRVEAAGGPDAARRER